MLKELSRKARRDERGITGLETAIILIAFVVVASVFAYTVLSAGIFSSQKGQEAIYKGLSETRSTLELRGEVVAEANSTSVTQITFTVANALDGEAIDLTTPDDVDSDGLADANSTNVCVISYASEGASDRDLAWSKLQLGKTDNDDLLEPGELFEITVDLTGVQETIATYHTFTVEVSPQVGSTLQIERTTPARLDSFMILN
jgi:flagellin FlaB